MNCFRMQVALSQPSPKGRGHGAEVVFDLNLRRFRVVNETLGCDMKKSFRLVWVSFVSCLRWVLD